MTQGEFFVLCVQVCVQKDPCSVANAMRALQAAANLDPAALAHIPEGTTMADAASKFALWHCRGGQPKEMPAWLREHETALRDRVVVRVNEATVASTWWLHAEQVYDDSAHGGGPIFPVECRALLLGNEKGIVLDRSLAEQFRAWVRNVPGSEDEPFVFEGVP